MEQSSGSEVSSVLDLNEIANRMSEWEQRRCRWIAPRLTESEALREAAEMVDRWNRMYLRVLRQLRDLRRYNPPVVVNNGGQVNIGEQQIIGYSRTSKAPIQQTKL